MPGALGELTVHGDQMAGGRTLARDDDPIGAHPALEGHVRGLERRQDHTFVQDLLGGLAQGLVGVFGHLLVDKVRVERPGVDADADRLVVFDGDPADGVEVGVAAAAAADVARIDAVLVQGLRTLGVIGKEAVAVIVKIADQRGLVAGVAHALHQLRDGGRGRFVVHRDPDQFRAGLGQGAHLCHSGLDVAGRRVGHGLHRNRGPGTDGDAAYWDANSLPTLRGGERILCVGGHACCVLFAPYVDNLRG